MIINGETIDDVLYKTSKELIKAPVYSPRNLKTKELIKAQLIIKNPEYSVISNPARKLSEEYLKAEFDWYNSGEKSIDKIKNYASTWKRIADKNGEVNSNYGEIIFKQELENYNGSQYDWVIESLNKDKDSRQAIINFNQPKHKSDTKDFVCTLATQYLIRNNKLISTTDMRSNDLIYGFSFDFPFFSYIQQRVLNDLKETYPQLKLGENIHTATSLHVYERHFNMIEEIVKEYEKNKPLSRKLEDII